MSRKLWRKSRPSPSAEGWTLIELIMTIVLAGILSIPVSYFIVSSIENKVYVEDTTTALQLARWIMEDSYREALTDAGYLALASRTYNNYFNTGLDVVRTVTYVAGSQFSTYSAKEVSVRVTRSGDSQVLTEFITYITRDIQYGV